MTPEPASGTTPDLDRAPASDVLLSARDVSVTFLSGGRPLRAVDGASLDLRRGETVALVGESGSGKTTLALTMMGGHRPEHGQIIFDGQDVTGLSERRMRPFRRRVQMVFQDPYASLDPRMNVERIVGEPLRAHGLASRAHRRERVLALLGQVGLPPDALDRRPAQFSGGQRQRIAIARALALEPDVLVADEPVSALDVSIQAQIINLLRALQRERTMSYLIVSHDLALVHHLADRVAVMYLGRIVEQASCDELVSAPLHPYTAALLSAAPSLGRTGARERIVLPGSPPSQFDLPPGCAFHPRCPIARPRCRVESPEPVTDATGREVACFHPGELPGPRLFDSSEVTT
ncbi:oligopeptide/dipeptide ABC transporter ATP-binding protein [Streptosporangium sp. NPDC001681]|uniref:ABC transporter ATP-binding protein n=1 Tax=Streptosporangium sp. NPDC001681 TaxID=3154395 RepID=UPI00331FD406